MITLTPVEQRTLRTRQWRRRALLRKGARLYSAMSANADAGTLAMLDEDGVIVSWYGGEDSAPDSVVGAHVSRLYVPEDTALGLPLRDLCTAAIHGFSTQMGWRRRPGGGVFWGTSIITAVLLRDGRLQGFSHVTHPSQGPWEVVHASRKYPPTRVQDTAANGLFGVGMPNTTRWRQVAGARA
ncbi:MAG TPA: hypothetical protein VHK24_13390 [Steroidobacter sp.]|nr:hypothetical protein [Steroidobacter sp.]